MYIVTQFVFIKLALILFNCYNNTWWSLYESEGISQPSADCFLLHFVVFWQWPDGLLNYNVQILR